MYLRKIFEILNCKMPSKLREDEWIIYLNASIRQYGKPLAAEDCYIIEATGGAAIYPLPEYVADGVKGVTVSGRELAAVLFGEELKDGCFWISPSGFLVLSFAPSEGEPVTVFFSAAREFKTAQEIAAEFADKSEAERKENYDRQECGVYDGFTDCIILGAMAEYAEATEDIAASDNFRNQCGEILRRAQQSRYAKRGKYPITRRVTKWKRYLFRR